MSYRAVRPPPEWATWSLNRAARNEADAAGPSRSRLKEDDDDDVDGTAITSLLGHRDDDGLHKSHWQDFEADRCELTSLRSYIEEERNGRQDVDALLRQIDDDAMHSSLQLTEYDKGKRRLELRLDEPSKWNFQPLTPTETKTLRRCLRLSKYVYDEQNEADEEEDYVSTGRKRKLGRPTTKAKVKASIKLGIQETARARLKNMLVTFMPRRNFDWIVSSLEHSRDVLGLERKAQTNETKRARTDEMIDAVRNATLPSENAALALYCLAQASGLAGLQKVRLTETSSDVKKTYRARDDQRKEADGVIKGLKILFPNFFAPSEAEQHQPVMLRSVLREQNSKLLQAILEYGGQDIDASSRTRSLSAPSTERTPDTSIGGTRSPTAEVKAEDTQLVADDNKSKEGEDSDDDENDSASEAVSDWGDLRYDQGPFDSIQMPRGVKYEDLSPYEQAMLKYDGKIPDRTMRKLLRNAKTAKRTEKEQSKKEEPKDPAEMKKLQRQFEQLEKETKKQKTAQLRLERKHAKEVEKLERQVSKARERAQKASLKREQESQKRAAALKKRQEKAAKKAERSQTGSQPDSSYRRPPGRPRKEFKQPRKPKPLTEQQIERQKHVAIELLKDQHVREEEWQVKQVELQQRLRDFLCSPSPAATESASVTDKADDAVSKSPSVERGFVDAEQEISNEPT